MFDKEGTMTVKHTTALAALTVVVAVAFMPAAGATVRSVQPSSPWYAYDAALRKVERQQQLTSSVQPSSPWYAYDAALRKVEHQRQQQLTSSVQPSSPWYAYDAALRRVEHLRLGQRIG
jgi:hypothetical protein